jgi:hypothetical protein
MSEVPTASKLSNQEREQLFTAQFLSQIQDDQEQLFTAQFLAAAGDYYIHPAIANIIVQSAMQHIRNRLGAARLDGDDISKVQDLLRLAYQTADGDWEEAADYNWHWNKLIDRVLEADSAFTPEELAILAEPYTPEQLAILAKIEADKSH